MILVSISYCGAEYVKNIQKDDCPGTLTSCCDWAMWDDFSAPSTGSKYSVISKGALERVLVRC